MASPFVPRLEPDGQRSHWLRVNRKMREAAGADAGDVVTLEIAPSGEEPEPRVPTDLRKALAAAPKARALWSDITPIARRDWIHWIVSAKRPETRARRVDNACAMLAAGKRRVCCFDRSGSIVKASALPKRRFRIKSARGNSARVWRDCSALDRVHEFPTSPGATMSRCRRPARSGRWKTPGVDSPGRPDGFFFILISFSFSAAGG